MLRGSMGSAMASFLLLGTTFPAAGQAAPGPGTRVRVTVPAQGVKRAEGTLRDTTGGMLVVEMRKSHDVRTFERASVEPLEVFAGERRPVLQYGVVGMLAGVGVGAVLGMVSGDDECPPNGWCVLRYTSGEKAVMFGASLGLVGLVSGLVAGAVSHHDTWRSVPRQTGRLTVHPVVGPGGTGVTLRFRVGRVGGRDPGVRPRSRVLIRG